MTKRTEAVMAGDGDETEQTVAIGTPGDRQSMPVLGHFVTYQDGADLRRVRIGAGGVTIGRQPPSQIMIAAPDISRLHCRIDLDGDWAVLTDMNSTNGTFLGDEKVLVPTRLRNGARVALGSTPIRYERRDVRDVAEEEELAAELRRAVAYVRAILPRPIEIGAVRADWWFVPSSHLGGEAFGYQFLDDGAFAGFVLDVSGHGIDAAMHAANVANVLRRRALPGVDFRDPAQVAFGLNAMFPMEEHNGLMLTMWYFVYDPAARLLRFCSAGHHAAYLLLPGAAEPAPLWARGPAIGMLSVGRWNAGEVSVPPGARLYVFSDGAFEIVTSEGRAWDIEDLRGIIAEPGTAGIPEARRLYLAVRTTVHPRPLEDDFAALVIGFDPAGDLAENLAENEIEAAA